MPVLDCAIPAEYGNDNSAGENIMLREECVDIPVISQIEAR
jgi:hypothetical protein